LTESALLADTPAACTDASTAIAVAAPRYTLSLVSAPILQVVVVVSGHAGFEV
jgi:hypothetical protein